MALMVPPYFGFSATGIGEAVGGGVGAGAGLDVGAGVGVGACDGAGVGAVVAFGPQETASSTATIKMVAINQNALFFTVSPSFIS